MSPDCTPGFVPRKFTPPLRAHEQNNQSLAKVADVARKHGSVLLGETETTTTFNITVFLCSYRFSATKDLYIKARKPFTFQELKTNHVQGNIVISLAETGLLS